MRLTFAARTGLIVVLSLTAAWIGSIAVFYLSATAEKGDPRPLPGQVAAVVELLERISGDERKLLLRALQSQIFHARIEPGLHIVETSRQLVTRANARGLQAHLAALGERPVSVVLASESGKPRGLSGRSFIAPVDLEIRVGLLTGETLIIEARSLSVTNFFGLPVGFVSGLLGSLIGLIALMIMHRETRPLMRLSAAVDRTDLAGSPVLLPEDRSGAPEVRALIRAFNRLQDRLSQLLRARMAMLGGISHDVRTFATRLRLRIDHMPAGIERDRAIADIADMIKLLDDALLASRAGANELDEELVELNQVVGAEVEDRRAAGHAVHLQMALEDADATVLGDRLALRRVVANLIDNALKYGQVAHLRVVSAQRSIVLTIDDAGAGIPPHQREAMLEPFVRLEASRNRGTGGAGLGLAVARNLVEAHGGTITITDAPTGGARLTVELPLFCATAAARASRSEVNAQRQPP
ncbi:sensor histidine kinase [Peristeroidobacter agariperforans]|uniref:sensor histidine kinase n=1 Tax=Peristeroidobacter agariperforans TaxID=268404 RepID=UPI001E5850E4|nr:ATP-binding protein [Peristeroidobacter agariperforans]